jgi:D-beta-D-heptose 7-phosphate kinase/D-beta-D-heptose 1-phosphate adenosyltransferase
MNLPSLQGVHVLVVGDVMLDRYWSGPARRVSQEAPVPVVNIEQVDERPGGAANVALNVASLGASCTLVGMVGDDAAAETLTSTLSAAGVHCDFVTVTEWPTIVKLRVVSQKQQLLRTDFEQALPADRQLQDSLASKVGQHLAEATVMVLQDYDKGTVAQPELLIAAARQAGVKVVVDPKQKPLQRYAGASVLKPNAEEFAAAVGAWSSDQDMLRKARELCAAHDIGYLAVTRGARGISVAAADGAHRHIPALPVDVYDVTGAGDTAAAALAVATSLGWQPSAAAELANVASGLVVSKAGTAAVSGPELAMALAQQTRGPRGRLSQSQLCDVIDQARRAGERIVFTNGCFDILHAGHVTYLEEARALGDRLVVAVNDDASVARLKGAGRPVNSLERRIKVLTGLQAVDYVVDFSDDTPEALLRLLRPDVLVKGGDYARGQVVGAEIVTEYGGDVKVLGLVDDLSTSALVAQVVDRFRGSE